MDIQKVKVEIIWRGDNVGCMMTEDGKVLDWADLNETEQTEILNGIASIYTLFRGFWKGDNKTEK